MKKVIKNQFKIIKFLKEDLISYSFLGKIISTDIEIVIKKFKTTHIPKDYMRGVIDKLEILKVLVHPHLQKIVDYEYIDGSLYVIYEKVDGKSLVSIVEGNVSLSEEKILYVIDEVSKSLEALYQKNFCHGAINLENIYILRDGSIKLCDYVINNDLNIYNLQYNHLVDYAMYYSPEQITNGVTTRGSDVYAMGVVIYRLFTGVEPYKNNCNVKKLLKEINKGIISPKKISGRLPSYINNLILKMLKVDASERVKNLKYVLETLVNGENVQSTEETCDDVQMVPDKDYINFDTRNLNKKNSLFRKLMIVFSISLILGGGFAFVYSIYLNYVYGLVEVRIPDVKGEKEDAAVQLLKELDLSPVIAGGRIDNTVSANCVISTLPEIGRVVKSGRVVRLFISKGKGMTNIPDLVGMKEEEAFESLKGMGLVPTVDKKVFSNTFPKGVIISQTPTANTLITPQSDVKLVVSEGYPVKMIVSPITESSDPNVVLTQIKFAIVEGWDENKIMVELISSGNKEIIYDEMHHSGDIMLLEFEEDMHSEVLIYFNGEVAYKAKLVDHFVEEL